MDSINIVHSVIATAKKNQFKKYKNRPLNPNYVVPLAGFKTFYLKGSQCKICHL